jgi:hypothetical protein
MNVKRFTSFQGMKSPPRYKILCLTPTICNHRFAETNRTSIMQIIPEERLREAKDSRADDALSKEECGLIWRYFMRAKGVEMAVSHQRLH